MKERPILMSGPMVRAILENRKTQTRRIVKFPKHVIETPGAVHEDGGGNWVAWSPGNQNGLAEFTKNAYPNGEGFPCPYGKVGDRLWVRETFGYYRPFAGDVTDKVIYRSDRDECGQYPVELDAETVLVNDREPWKPSIFMPRWASRLTLEIVSVGVERLWEITDVGAIAEGVDRTNTSIPYYARERFKKLWESINGERSPWDSNPWVWVIEFKRANVAFTR